MNWLSVKLSSSLFISFRFLFQVDLSWQSTLSRKQRWTKIVGIIQIRQPWTSLKSQEVIMQKKIILRSYLRLQLRLEALNCHHPHLKIPNIWSQKPWEPCLYHISRQQIQVSIFTNNSLEKNSKIQNNRPYLINKSFVYLLFIIIIFNFYIKSREWRE